MNPVDVTCSGHLLAHFAALETYPLPAVPTDISWLLPLREHPAAPTIFAAFINRFYADDQPRTLVLGINPGRFGGGLTNIAFTDPVQLRDVLGIPNSLPPKTELSAQFVYQVIAAMGGPTAFYQRFFLNSLCPFGFVKAGKNYNYYDERALQKAVEPLIHHHLQELIAHPTIRTDRCYCLGEGKNYQFFQAFNQAHGFFGEVIPLAHPRYIMQYRRKDLNAYVDQYVDLLNTTS